MGSIRSYEWNGRRHWFIDYVAGDGRRVRQVIGPGDEGQRVAKKVLRREEAKARLGLHGIVPAEIPGFAAHARDWLKRIAVAPKTYESYEGAVRLHLIPHFGDTRLDKITKADIENWRSATANGTRRGKKKEPVPLSPRTVNNALNILRFIFRDAVENRKAQENPAARVKPLPEVPTKERLRVIPPEELDRLLEAAEEPWRTLWLVLAHCGLRRGEGLGLKWSDVDLKVATLTVRRSIGRVRRQKQDGSYFYEVIEKRPKTPESFNTVPMTPAVVQALLDLPTSDEDPFVFRSPTTERGPMDPDNTDRAFARHLLLAGLSEVYTIHDLRHTAASLYLAAGVPMKTVQRILRHSQFRTTADTYAHLLPDSLEDATGRLQAFLLRQTEGKRNGNGAGPKTDPAKLLDGIESSGRAART